jgi:outer membrane protein assembly factor BamA
MFSLFLVVFSLWIVFSSSNAEGKVSIIPLPAISTSRNEGLEVGNLTAILFTDEKGIVNYIMAPSVTYNETTGVNLFWRLLGFQEGDRDYQIVVGHSIDVDYEFSGRYQDPHFLNGRYAYSVDLSFFRDTTYRFFGFTSQSRSQDETNYTDGELKALLSFGINLNPSYRLSFAERIRRVRIDRGKVKSLPFITNIFSNVPGLPGALILAHQLSLAYDSRDDTTTTTTGSYAAAYAEIDHDYENNASPFQKFGLDLRTWFPLAGKRYITALRGQVELTTGLHRPFYEQSSLGGEDSLRNFGANRYIDDHSVLFNIEERMDLMKMALFGVRVEWEFAPFLDVGKVFSDFGKRVFQDYQVNPGIGLRAIVRPNVVGRFDFGFGPEGSTVFVGLGFPF